MAQVSLKSYENEMRDLIEADAFDEAMAIGQHILQYYPKDLRTYGLLGECCLGKGLHQEAADLFLRVLSVDPENVAARVGLSRAYEARGDIDNAVDQMRTAYDLAPSLAYIHSDLHGLLQRQSGGEAPKLKLTRQGLGRIYVRGELYTQAADEFEALLRENPDQVDTQVSLADALWRDSQRIRAIEVCQSVLNKLPYCLKAHLILAETWLRSDREDEAESHLKVIEELDPDGDIAHGLMGDASPASRVSATLPDLESAAAAVEDQVAAQSETATVELEEAALPEWLRDDEPEDERTEGDVAAGALERAELPAWLSAGAAGAVTTLDTDKQQEGVHSATETDSAEGIEEIPEEGVPEWLREATPQESQAEATARESTVLPPGGPEDWAIAEEAATAAVAAAGAVTVATETDEGDEPSSTGLDIQEEAITPREERAIVTESDFEAEPEGTAAPPEHISMVAGEGPADVEPGEMEGQEPGPVAEEIGPEDATAEGELLEKEEPEPNWLRILREESQDADLPPGSAVVSTEGPEAEVTLGVAAAEALSAEAPAEADIHEMEDETPPLAQEAELPDWLRDLQESEGISEAAPKEPSLASTDVTIDGLSRSNEEEEEAELVDWLHDAQEAELTEAVPEQDAGADELLAPGSVDETESIALPAEQESAWLRETRDGGSVDETTVPSDESVSEAVLVDTAAAESTLPDAILASTPAVPQPGTVAEDAVVDGEDIEQPAPIEESQVGLPTEEDLEEIGLVREGKAAAEKGGPEDDALPEWLRKAAFAEGFVETVTEAEPQEESDSPRFSSDVPPSSPEEATAAEVPPVPESAEEGGTPEWLELLQREGASQYVMPEELEDDELVPESTSALDEEDLEIPEWLQMLRQGQQEESADVERVVDVSPGTETTELSEETAAEDEAVTVLEEHSPPPSDELPGPAGPATEEEVELGEVFPGKETSEAIIADYEAMLEEDPNDDSTRWELLKAYANTGDHVAAIEHGERLVRSGEFLDEIIAYVEALAESGAGTRQVYETLGEAYFKQDRFQEATDAYRKALSQLG